MTEPTPQDDFHEPVAPDRPADADGPDLAALQRLCDAATPEPWEVDEDECVARTADWRPLVEVKLGDHDTRDDPQQAIADLRFIAAARTVVPWLLARVADLEAERDRLTGELETMTEVARSNKRHVAYLTEHSEQMETDRNRLAAHLAQVRPQPGTPDDLPALRRRIGREQAERAVIEAARAWAADGWNTTTADRRARHLYETVNALDGGAFESADSPPPAPKADPKEAEHA